MSDDLAEFLELSKDNDDGAASPVKRSRGQSKALATKDEECEGQAPGEKKPKQGQPIQYSHFAHGFVPTTETIKKLPPGCYRIENVNNVNIFAPKDVVTDALLRLPDSKSDEVIEEVETFWTLKPLFNKYGFSHKRGFLLWGPPGSGKTCTIAQIIEKMVKAGGIVILADAPGSLGMMLYKLRCVEPNRPMVVIWEDLDTVIDNYGEAEVLAILDGESQVDNVVFIATTNYPEKLDSRIVNRPSRFDRIVKIDMPNDAAREVYLNAKLGHTEHTQDDGVTVNLVKETKGLSIAHLRELIIGVYCQKNKAQDVLKRLHSMKIKPKSGFESEGNGMGLRSN